MTRQVFSAFDSEPLTGGLTPEAIRLIEQQKSTWPLCGSGYSALQDIQVRDIACSTFSVRLQCNPKRLASTGAKVDQNSISKRPCFLCAENLPEEQKGILYRGDFMVLVNPAPIFEQHFTITHVRHQVQALEPFLDSLFALSKELAPAYTLFYNGPRCGASAPDHMHFQACPKDAIPVERDARDPKRRKKLMDFGSTVLLTLKEYGRSVLVFESTDAVDLKVMVRRLLAAVGEVLSVEGEPMLNTICTYRDGVWRMIIFLRAKHRPDVYFEEGENRIVVSPASVDIGGLIIAPRERDFERLTASMIEAIFTEVSLTNVQMDAIVQAFDRVSKIRN